MLKCANAPLARVPCTLGGLRVKSIQVSELPLDAV
jgi:hypothetical protein